jgi:hypothetical protein
MPNKRRDQAEPDEALDEQEHAAGPVTIEGAIRTKAKKETTLPDAGVRS